MQSIIKHFQVLLPQQRAHVTGWQPWPKYIIILMWRDIKPGQTEQTSYKLSPCSYQGLYSNRPLSLYAAPAAGSDGGGGSHYQKNLERLLNKSLR